MIPQNGRESDVNAYMNLIVYLAWRAYKSPVTDFAISLGGWCVGVASFLGMIFGTLVTVVLFVAATVGLSDVQQPPWYSPIFSLIVTAISAKTFFWIYEKSLQ